LCNNRFAKADLFGKLANISADLSDQDLKYTGDFKRLTGRDLFITAEEKWGQPFKYTNHAPLFSSANKIPKTPDKTRAFYKRWCIIQLPYHFVMDPDPDDPLEKQRDPQILEKLTTKEELNGFLLSALKGLHRVLKNGRLTIHQTWKEIKEIYEKQSDQYASFIKEEIREVPNAIIPRKKVYNKYKEWVTGKKFQKKN